MFIWMKLSCRRILLNLQLGQDWLLCALKKDWREDAGGFVLGQPKVVKVTANMGPSGQTLRVGNPVLDLLDDYFLGDQDYHT